MMTKINIALVGYGSQGRRIAEAVSLQPDIQLVGIGLKEPDLSTSMAFKKGFPIYVMDSKDVPKFHESKIDEQGLFSDLLSHVDVVVDATPSGVGRKNKELYSKYGVKAIFQAGEPFDVADVPVFVCRQYYETAKRASFVRIPTPYTVSLFRTLDPLGSKFGIKDVQCTFIMPGAEPMRGQTGPVDTIIPDKPALWGVVKEEYLQIMPKPLMLSSLKVPSNLLGIACIVVQLNSKFSTDDVIAVLSETPRVILVRSEKGLDLTDSIFEYVRRTVRSSADVYEVCVWHEQIEVMGNTLKLVQAFDSHCVQTPEVIDAIRALAGKEEMEKSFYQTNKALGILSPGEYP
jgi:glyceraldehyde-3-phosphate dehydrogenase (NAD(P))